MSRGARSKSATHNSRDSSGIVQVLVAKKKLGRSNDKQFEFLMLRDILIYLFLIQMPFAFAKKLITENSPLPVANITEQSNDHEGAYFKDSHLPALCSRKELVVH